GGERGLVAVGEQDRRAVGGVQHEHAVAGRQQRCFRRQEGDLLGSHGLDVGQPVLAQRGEHFRRHRGRIEHGTLSSHVVHPMGRAWRQYRSIVGIWLYPPSHSSQRMRGELRQTLVYWGFCRVADVTPKLKLRELRCGGQDPGDGGRLTAVNTPSSVLPSSSSGQCTLTVSSSWLQALAIAASRLSVSMIGVPSAPCSANNVIPGASSGACGKCFCTSSERMDLT